MTSRSAFYYMETEDLYFITSVSIPSTSLKKVPQKDLIKKFSNEHTTFTSIHMRMFGGDVPLYYFEDDDVISAKHGSELTVHPRFRTIASFDVEKKKKTVRASKKVEDDEEYQKYRGANLSNTKPNPEIRDATFTSIQSFVQTSSCTINPIIRNQLMTMSRDRRRVVNGVIVGDDNQDVTTLLVNNNNSSLSLLANTTVKIMQHDDTKDGVDISLTAIPDESA